MKKRILVILLAILTLLLIIRFTINETTVLSVFGFKDVTLESLPDHETIKDQGEQKYKVYYCEIKDIKNDTYYVHSKNGFKFTFSEKRLKEKLPSLKIGDIIKLYFDVSGNVHELVKVEKVD